MVELGTTIESPQTGERLTFLSTADSSNGELFRAELVVQPGSYVVGLHIHPRQEEQFVVFEGQYGWRIGETTGGSGPGRKLHYEHRPALTSAEIFFETQFGLSRDGKLTAAGGFPLLQAAVLLQEVGDFIRPASPPLFTQDLLFAPLAILGRLRGYRARYPQYRLPSSAAGAGGSR
jgi:hypothetical protein